MGISKEMMRYGRAAEHNLSAEIFRVVKVFSNPSLDNYKQNTHADCTVKLAHPVDLNSTSNWEVGLCENS